jgi:hypothetical protein
MWRTFSRQSKERFDMSASELMYFDGAPLAHVVAFEERERLERIAAKVRTFERERRRGGSR